ncbi:MAG: hypothetical protein R2806_18805 [Saprospiraceae bacterium]
MFGKVKRLLGIEGVKIDLDIPAEIPINSPLIIGKIQLYTIEPQTVTEIEVKCVEKYSRGRRKAKLIDEYTLGDILLRQNIEVPKDEMLEVDFELPIQWMKSRMDRIEENNFLLRGMVKAAKTLRGAKSSYRIIAEAKVKGTALHPFAEKPFIVK